MNHSLVAFVRIACLALPLGLNACTKGDNGEAFTAHGNTLATSNELAGTYSLSFGADSTLVGTFDLSAVCAIPPADAGPGCD